MGRRKTYILILAVILIGTASVFAGSKKTESVRAGYASPIIPAGWQSIISDSISREQPDIYLNDRIVEHNFGRPYVTSTLDPMIPVSLLTEKIGAHVTVSGTETLYLYFGERRIKISLNSDWVTVNGESTMIAGAAAIKNDIVYVSGKLLTEILPYEISFNAGDNRIDIKKSESNINNLPSYFSLAEVERMPAVLNQGSSGTCWAFASLTALESFILPVNNGIFSREHMVLMNDAVNDLNRGGDGSAALSYLLSWKGPVIDPDDIYGDGLIDKDALPARHVQGAGIYYHMDREAIKQAVFKYGGVEASIYLSMADASHLSDSEIYYNRDTAAYCYDGDRNVNHDVVIIGWDDRFERSNFARGDSLPGDGAFICMNSWGETFGRSGIFFVSYYDKTIGTSAVYFDDVDLTNNYDRIYQTDLAGQTAAVGYNSETAYFANVYTACANELLAAVGFYTLGENSTYEIYATSKYTNPQSLTGAAMIAKATLDHSGYHTIDLNDVLFLTEGEQFAVIVKLTTEGVNYPVAVEKNTADFPDADISDGMGFTSSNGMYFRRSETENDCNICLKAYTVYRLREEK